MNWFGQVAQQVADHEDFRHSHGEMASVENSTGCVTIVQVLSESCAPPVLVG